MTLVCDLERASVEYIGEERRESGFCTYFAALSLREREAVQAISLDIWPAYINACRHDVPGADLKMVFDRFHIMRHVLEAVDTVRKREHRALLSEGHSTLNKSKLDPEGQPCVRSVMWINQ